MELKISGENNSINIIRSVGKNQGSNESGYLEAEKTNCAGASLQGATDQITITFQNMVSTPKNNGAELSINFKNLTRNSFTLFDTNNDGAVSKDEWQKLKLDPESFKVISKGADKINKFEWDTYIDQLQSARLSMDKRPDNWSEFDFYTTDLNRDGKISKIEWNMAGGNQEIFDSFPKDNNGNLTIVQWDDFMKGLG